MGREEAVAVLEGVRTLPEDRREALIMRFALGMDNREIARALGRTDGATKVLIHRAIKQLEQEIEARSRRSERGAVTQTAGQTAAPDRIERLLETALAPVEPPAGLVDELEVRLAEVRRPRSSARGALRLGARAMRDPRNWVRPAAARGRGRPRARHWCVLQLRRGRRQRGGRPQGHRRPGRQGAARTPSQRTRGRLR